MKRLKKFQLLTKKTNEQRVVVVRTRLLLQIKKGNQVFYHQCTNLIKKTVTMTMKKLNK